MANTVAVLNILVNANTSSALAGLTAVDGKLKQTETTAKRTTGTLGKFGSVAKTGALAGVAALGYGLFKSSQKAAEFEKKMSSLGAVSEASTRQMKALEKQAMRLGSATAFSANEAADAQIELAKGGLKVKQILGGGLQSALALAAAGELDVADAAATTVNAMNLFSLRGKDAMKVADMLATAANTTTGDVQDFAKALQMGGSVAKMAGLDLNETITILEALAEAGIKNSDAGTSMKTFFQQITRDVPKAKDAMADLNLEFFNQRGELKSLPEISRNMRQAFGDLTKEQFLQKAGVIAGSDAVRTLWALYDAGPEKIRKLTKANEEQGTAAKVAREKQNNLAGDMEKFSGSAETLAIIVGKKINPKVRDAVQFLTKLTDAFAVLFAANPDQAMSRLANRSKGLAVAMRIVHMAIKVFGDVASTVWNHFKELTKNTIDIVVGLFKFLKAWVKIVTAVFKGDWKKAWDGVKQLFAAGKQVVLGALRTMTAPFRSLVRLAGRVLTSVFKDSWGTVKDIFWDGAKAVIGVVNTIIGVLNKIPGVDIGKIKVVGDEGSAGTKVPGGHATHRQRGGMLYGGKPSGDSIPAVLERGEYVLNRKAVQAVGKKQLDAVNFGHAPRFQTGGAVGLSVGGALSDVAGMAADGIKYLPGGKAVSGLAGKVLGKGAGWFIDQLPDPKIPEPFSGVGPWLIDHVTEWIKKKVPKANYGTGGGSMFQGLLVADWIAPILQWAQQHGWAGSITSGYRDPSQVVSNAQGIVAPQGQSNHNSLSYPGGAIDVGDPGARTAGQALASVLAGYPGKPQLVWGGPVINDWGHFSATGHQKGGLIRGMMRGGAAEHAVVKKVGADLLKHGFNFRSACGILGNAWREGLWNPSQLEYGNSSNGGLFGFTAGEKSLSSLKAYASGLGKPWDDAIVQTHFMLKTGGLSLKGALNALNSIPKSAEKFMNSYEIPAPETNGLSERVAAGFDAMNILKDAGIIRAGDVAGGEDQGMSEAEKRKAHRKALRESREKRVRELIQKAFGSSTAAGKKGSLWQILDLYAQYGDFGSVKGGMLAGGVTPGGETSEKAMFLQRAGRIASIANPNRGAGQLYSLVKWLQDHVGLTGAEDGDDHLAKKLANVREAGKGRAKDRRERKWAKIARFGENFPWGKRLNQNESRLEFLREAITVANREAGAEWSPGGSDYTDSEVLTERNLNLKLLGGLDRKYRWILEAIPYVKHQIGYYENLIAGARKNPAERWKIPGYQSGLKAAKATLAGGYGGTGLKQALIDVVGLTGLSGEWGATIYRLKELGFMSTVEKGSASDRDVALADINLGLLENAQKTNAILAAQLPVYQQHMPKFHTGGDVPGHGDVMAMVKGGETVYTSEQNTAIAGALSDRFGTPIVNVFVNGVQADPGQVRVEVDRQFRTKLSQGRRAGSNVKARLPQ